MHWTTGLRQVPGHIRSHVPVLGATKQVRLHSFYNKFHAKNRKKITAGTVHEDESHWHIRMGPRETT